MADIVERVREETSIDLSNALLIVDQLAPEFGERINKALESLADGIDIAQRIFDAFKVMSAANLTPLAVYQLAYGAVMSAIQKLNEAAAKTARENITRREATRNGFIASYYPIGAWSRVFSAKRAPTPANLDLVRGIGQKAAEHLSQYDPRELVWHASRVARRQVLRPTWNCWPYDEPGRTPESWEDGVDFSVFKVTEGGKLVNDGTLLGGFDDDGNFRRQPPSTAPIPPEYVDKYWGNAPNAGGMDLGGTPDGKHFDWAAIDAGVFIQGYAPVPDYHWLLSLGTWPYTSWNGIAGGTFEHPRQDFCVAAMSIAAAIHSPTPWHAMIRFEDVAVAYRHFLKVTGLRNLPLLPDHQVDSPSVFLNDELLPVSNVATPLTLPGTPFAWPMVAAIEKSFRSFFRLRRALLFQFDLAGGEFKAAAAKSPDATLRGIAAGKPAPAYAAWDPRDPLGDGWIKAGTRPSFGGGSKVVGSGQGGGLGGGGLVGPGGLKGSGQAASSAAAAVGAAVVAGGGLAYWFARRRRRGGG